VLGARRVVFAVSCLLACSSLASATDVTGALTFIGIAPCRIADTRGIGGFTGQAGPPALVAGASRSFAITGVVAGVPLQCGIPANAVAISVNLTAVGFTGAGDLRAYPAGGALPAASILNYSLENIANSAEVPLGAAGIAIRCDVSATNVVIDVNGYYVARPVSISIVDSAGSTSSVTPATVASIYSADFTAQGHTTGRLVARFNNNQQAPACTGNIQVDLVQTAACSSTTGGTVLTTMTRNCGFKAWLEYSPVFTIPAGPACIDLRIGAPAGGTASWRSINLELTR